MNASDPTRREPAFDPNQMTSATRREPAPGAHAAPATGSALLTLQGDLAERFDLLGELPTRGGEADLFLLRSQGDQSLAVLKLYRSSIHPKASVAETLFGLDRRYVIGLVDTGKMHERSYEVMEYAAGGSLRRLLQQNMTPEQSDALLSALVPQLAAILDYLHGLEPKLSHRDLKPDNILLREVDPPVAVVTDFGISSLSDFTVHMTKAAGTPRYMAPEALGENISPAVDWWSLGMIVLEIASGEPPFSGMPDTEIFAALTSSRRINLSSVERRLPHWAGLIAGLLQRKPASRWSGSQVRAWLAGDAEARLHGQRLLLGEAVSERKPAVATQPYRIADHECWTAHELGMGLAANWGEAVKGIARGFVEQWLQQKLGDQNWINLFLDILEERVGDPPGPLPPEQQLLLLLRALLPEAIPIADQDRVLDPDDVRTCLQAAAGLADAQARMAGLLLAGRKLTPDAALARRLATEAAGHGDPLGVQLARDIATFEAATQAASNDDPEGYARLGQCYEDGVGTPVDLLEAERCHGIAAEGGVASAQFLMGQRAGNKGDDEQAAMWFGRAAEQGHLDATNDLGSMQAEGQVPGKTHSDAAILFHRAASQGHALAQSNLSYLYANGYGVERDGDAALRWALQSAEADLPVGHYRAGLCYRYGWGTEPDDGKAFGFFLRAAEKGHASAQCQVGEAYEYGRGVERDMGAAAKWHHAAALQNNAESEYRNGYYWHKGDELGLNSDLDTAKYWYDRAAEHGQVDAMWMLAGIYRYETPAEPEKAVALYTKAGLGHDHAASLYMLARMVDDGEGVTRDYAESARLYLSAAQKGHAAAAFEYGRACENGWGVDVDLEAAAHWYLVAAEKGDFSAQFAYGRFLADGIWLEEDGEKAVQWFLRAAEQDHARACYRLGCICRDGGLEEYQAGAVRWFERAVELNDNDARYELARLRRDGRGGAVDLAAASQLFKAAAEGGHTDAKLEWARCLGQGLGVRQNAAKALTWFEAAATDGNVSAMAEAGYAYENGLGTPADARKAMWFYSRAADAGDTWSMVQLGIVYEEGLGGTENPTLALAYFERAAAAGNARGDYGMGRILTAGLAEGGRNERRALEHFCKAAEAGVSGAQLQAGLAYLAGRGTARNPATAAGWLRKAADAGETEAQAIVGEMLWQGNGVPADKAEARRLAEASAAAGCERGVRLLAALNSPPAPLQKLQAFGEDTGINKIVGGVWPSLDRFFNKRP